jgi:hypothetical protein
MTRRFDRGGDRKHHVQTLGAMAHLDYRLKGAHDASQRLRTIEALGLGYEALAEAFRRIAPNAKASNCDDHPKIVSFLLRQGGAWELAPACDLTHAHNPQGEWTHQHLASVNGKFYGFGSADLLTAADRFGIATAQRIFARSPPPWLGGRSGLQPPASTRPRWRRSGATTVRSTVDGTPYRSTKQRSVRMAAGARPERALRASR